MSKIALVDFASGAHHHRTMPRDFVFRFIVFMGCLLFGGSCALANDGARLAKTWCSGCHSFPDPRLLDKKTWINTVLPDMGARLGLRSFRGRSHPANPNAPRGVYASEPAMTQADWESIISWYENKAPSQLGLPETVPTSRLQLFGIEVPRKKKHDFPTSTAVFIDEASQRLLVGDSYELDVEIYDKNLALLSETRSGGAVSRIVRTPSGDYLATIMGGNIGQAELPLGLLIKIAADENARSPSSVRRVVRRLHRPVDVVFGDFNHDGTEDFVLAEFGTHFGKLSLHLGQPDGSLKETVLLSEAGALSISVVGDDLLVLMAQGDERIVRLKNFADGKAIVAQTLLRFAPSQGSSSMSVLDFNGDGVPDLLYTAGDNADISPVFKPYHGIYLFAGQGDGTYRQEMFFHLDGATSAVARDFDQDGDMDIAAIAYYGNIERGIDKTGFVYLENTGGEFSAKFVEGVGKLGRFVAITAGDIDGDGDVDIALANMAFGPYGPLKVTTAQQDQWLRGPRFILLRNRLH